MKISRLSKYATARTVGLFFLAGLLGACASTEAIVPTPVTAFRLISPGLPDNGMLAQKNTANNKANPNCDGANVSPPLQWFNAPKKTVSFIIMMHDQAGRAGLGVSHWLAYGIPDDVASLAEGEASGPSKQYVIRGKGTRGSDLYAGPCPPRGSAPQHYVFTLIATDLNIEALRPGLTQAEVLESLKGHALSATSLVLRYAH